jgi:rhodanese-related sulfurtransferase
VSITITRTRALATALAVLLAAGAGAQALDPTRVTQEEFKKLMDADNVLVVDVRPPDAYRQGHIAGALSIPLANIEKNVEVLKASKKPIVTYCT